MCSKPIGTEVHIVGEVYNSTFALFEYHSSWGIAISVEVVVRDATRQEWRWGVAHRLVCKLALLSVYNDIVALEHWNLGLVIAITDRCRYNKEKMKRSICYAH